MAALQVRKWISHVEEIMHDGGPAEKRPLVKAAVGVVIGNPFAGRYSTDLAALIEPSAQWARELGERAVTISGPDVPRPDELFIVAAVATGARVHHRAGGLAAADIQGGGLR